MPECASAGAWNACASDGVAIVAAARSASVDTIRVRSELNRCTPFFRPPTKKAIPSTSTLFARIEPTRADCTTVTSPLLQREEGDEQLGQVAERRLDDAGPARAEPRAELLGPAADEPGERGQRDRSDDECRHVAEREVAESGNRDQPEGD